MIDLQSEEVLTLALRAYANGASPEWIIGEIVCEAIDTYPHLPAYRFLKLRTYLQAAMAFAVFGGTLPRGES